VRQPSAKRKPRICKTILREYMSPACRTVVGTGAFLYRRACRAYRPLARPLTLTATWRSGYAAVCKFYERCLCPSSSIPERPALSGHFECPSVPHPFLSRTVPSCSVAISVATDLNCSRTSERVQVAPSNGLLTILLLGGWAVGRHWTEPRCQLRCVISLRGSGGGFDMLSGSLNKIPALKVIDCCRQLGTMPIVRSL
jgi:hypothetical protein